MPTVLIAGANRGIGLEFVRQYVRAGERVLAACRTPAKAEALAKIAQGADGRVTVLEVDVASDESVRELERAVGEQPIDILLAVAGVMGPSRQQRPGEFDFPGWIETLSVNTLGPLRLAEAFRDNLRAGQGRKLIALTSGMGSTAGGGGGYFAYRSSKAALNNAWRNLSYAYRADGIVCVAMSPGWVKTDMGGSGAELTPEQSVTSMRRLIAAFGPADSGRYVGWRGEDIPW
jgi:NAD(P)-dependent dehydrogenase (short-subunit alcohol dehydrogenase family)